MGQKWDNSYAAHRRSASVRAALIMAVIFVMTALAAVFIGQQPSLVSPAVPDSADAYLQALNTATGWSAATSQELAGELSVGHTICRMLAAGWNEAGVVANMLTWPSAAGYTQNQLSTFVHVTHTWLCGQPA